MDYSDSRPADNKATPGFARHPWEPSKELTPHARQALSGLLLRLARRETAFEDGAVRLCVVMEWIGAGASPGDTNIVEIIAREAEQKLLANPDWANTLEDFVGTELIATVPISEGSLAGRGHIERPCCKDMALSYAAKGWPVFPVHSIQMVPAPAEPRKLAKIPGSIR